MRTLVGTEEGRVGPGSMAEEAWREWCWGLTRANSVTSRVNGPPPGGTEAFKSAPSGIRAVPINLVVTRQLATDCTVEPRGEVKASPPPIDFGPPVVVAMRGDVVARGLVTGGLGLGAAELSRETFSKAVANSVKLIREPRPSPNPFPPTVVFKFVAELEAEVFFDWVAESG